ncbi:hypothetical protein K505DRAFT_329615, partial [Melanomma pulvis-pyrius CBS 109.77]
MVLAKIVKEDQKLLWVRVASRFKDKAGRAMHPETLREKVLGKSEGQSREGSKAGSVKNGWGVRWL